MNSHQSSRPTLRAGPPRHAWWGSEEASISTGLLFAEVSAKSGDNVRGAVLRLVRAVRATQRAGGGAPPPQTLRRLSTSAAAVPTERGVSDYCQ